MRFYKMTGSGNDFVCFDGREAPAESWSPSAIQALCDRRTGVGGDGLVVVSPEPGDSARMVYFNADGSRAGMCGNAALCSTRLASRLGFAPGSGMSLHTDSGLRQPRCVGPAWGAELLLPDFAVPALEQLPLGPGEHWMKSCNVGVPHLVILVEDISRVDVEGRGGSLRRHP